MAVSPNDACCEVISSQNVFQQEELKGYFLFERGKEEEKDYNLSQSTSARQGVLFDTHL